MPHPITSEPSWELVPDSNPPKYARPLQGAELMHDYSGRLGDGLSEVVMGATFKSTLSTKELEKRTHDAIGRMRFAIPILACAIQSDPTNPFSSSFIYTTVPSQDALHAWISATLTIRHHDGTFDPEAFVAEMNALKTPYVHPASGHQQPSHFYLLLSSEEGVHGLFMHGPHTLMDARPTLRCLDVLLDWIVNPPAQTLDQLAWGTEWKALPVPPITATGGTRDDWDTEGVKLMNELIEMVMHPVPTHSLIPPRRTIATPGKMTRAHATFDRETSARIVRACKELGFTPSALFDASVALATFAKNPVKPEDVATAHFTFDPTVIAQDRYLVPPHTGLSHFIAGLALVLLRVPYSSIPFSSPPREQLIAIMSQLKPQLDHFLQNPNLPHVLPAQLVLHPPRQAEDISNLSPSITSNMGNVSLLLKDKGQKEVEIVDMVFGHRLPWQRILFHCWSLKGEMRLQVQASDVWDAPLIDEYLADVQALMLRILDAPSSTTEAQSNGSTQTAISAPNPDPAPAPAVLSDEPLAEMPDPSAHFTPTTHHAPYPFINPKPSDLAGRVVFVSGATSCVGQAAVIALAQAGVEGLVLTARASKMNELDALEESIGKTLESNASKPEILKIPLDILDASSIASAVSSVRKKFVTLDTLLNVSGTIDPTVPLTLTDPSEWWNAIETNLRGTFAVTHALLPLIKASKSDVKYIVNYASISAAFEFPVISGYILSKLALLRLTTMLSHELTQPSPFAPSSPNGHGITILALHPGFVPSPLSTRSVRPQDIPALIDSPDLSGQSVAWLVKEKRHWLSGRFVSCSWDMKELEERKEEVVSGDLLKVKIDFGGMN